VEHGPDAENHLAELVLDAPGLGRITLVEPKMQRERLPHGLDSAGVDRALAGKEVASELYISNDSTPSMDVCTPSRAVPKRSVCAQLDLLEMWRFVQDIRVGEAGYALAFDAEGRIIASGAGVLRAAILTQEPVRETPFAVKAAADLHQAPVRYLGPAGEPVLAGWAQAPRQGWTVVVEQPEAEVFSSALIAQRVFMGVLLLALIISMGVGWLQSHRVLKGLEAEERWRTAGQIAAGISHDLGHRLRILQQTVALAEANDPAFLPRIRDNLRSEVSTLEKFVSEFADLSRNVAFPAELHPIELGAFIKSLEPVAAPHAQASRVRLELTPPPGPVWVRGDRHMMQRALLNLLCNAIEASPQGGVVTLRLFERHGQGVVEVQDQGAGIEPARLGEIFSAFRSTKRTGAHVGMGLPNVKRIIDAHRGEVRVQSQVGAGTTFVIRLATVPSETMAASAPAQSSSSSPPSAMP
jgi:signal transduction histidine kinase